MTDREKTIEAIARAILERQGFGFYTDPMEGGQDAYDITRAALEDGAVALTALSSAGRLVGEAERWAHVRTVHDRFKRDIEQGYKTRDKEFAITLLGRALASAPHPAPDATVCPKAYAVGGVVPITDCSALVTNSICSVCGVWRAAPDATDWKARCEAEEIRAEEALDNAQAENDDLIARHGDLIEIIYTLKPKLTAAQAENEKLRAALDAAAMYARARSECYGSSPMGTYAEGHKDASSILLTQIEALIAALSPPPLSPEKE
jgi:hypothetical protein